MEMHQIRYFLAVAETLNFTRAAEQCRVAQPSLSQAIRKLEEELGGDLFRRERNRTHLTGLGREMLPMLRHAFDSAAAAKDRAARYRRADHAPLRIGLSLTVGLDAIAPKLAELARAFPGLDLHVLRAAGTAALEALKAGETELCIAADIDTEWDRVDRWPLFEEGFVLLATEPREPAMPASAEADATALIARPYCETWRRHFAQSAPGDATRRYRHEVSSEEDAALLASLGMGVALLPASIGRSLAASTATAYDSGLVRSVHVYGVAGRQRSPAANALLVLLRAADWTVPAATG